MMAPFTWGPPRSTPDMCLRRMQTPTTHRGYPLVIYWDGGPTCQLPSGHSGVHKDSDYHAQWSDHWSERAS